MNPSACQTKKITTTALILQIHIDSNYLTKWCATQSSVQKISVTSRGESRIYSRGIKKFQSGLAKKEFLKSSKGRNLWVDRDFKILRRLGVHQLPLNLPLETSNSFYDILRPC